MKAGLTFYWLLIFCLLTACQSAKPSVKIPIAKEGILDLRSWDFNNHGPIALDGEWEFYWEKLYAPKDFLQALADTVQMVQVPNSWNSYHINNKYLDGDGFATYRLLILVSKVTDGQFSVRVPIIYTASNMWVNGQQVYSSGKVSNSHSISMPQYKPEVVDVVLNKNPIEIIIQVSNFHYSNGGLRQPIRLGLESHIRDSRLKSIAVEFWLEGSILIMALYHLGLFFIRRRDLTPLYFSLFCLLIALRIFITGEYTIHLFFDPDWDWVIRLEYLTFFLGSAAFVLFLYTVFNAVFGKRVVYVVFAMVAIYVFMALFTTPFFFTSAVTYFQLFTVLIAIYGLYVIIRACILHLEGSYSFLFGYLFFVLTFFNDLLYSHKIIYTGNYISLGLFVFIFSQAFLLTRRFSFAFSELESSNRKLLEANTMVEEQNEQLWQLNSELDSFVYRTSHDLRAPVASVMGLINIARQDNDIEQNRHCLELMDKSLNKLDRVIRDIIDYSKNKNLGFDIKKIDFNLGLHEIFASHDFMENAYRIDKSVEWTANDFFYTDQKRIDIILNNLISNAIRYYNPSQQHPFIKVKVSSDSTTALIEVIDNGLGIAKEYQTKIFDMFFRISNHGDGSGVGLYIVKETVQKLSGEISVESELNKGTVFRVKLPNLKYKMNGL
ncbi:GHKL domain-containing protein [Rhodocytophaga rosea]|uniref:histidine kinase n=1 Tax=Rhodocytophaga rosea TaxID=2704465 RepID=A0A6C0GVZ3_9BACT|nr:7TM diverse intracellular signaling domain-containing protein [Rhodocytophaga rosea]QHT71502.1 GHKL domain-containing protein [Rhodocytophaga rosea]